MKVKFRKDHDERISPAMVKQYKAGRVYSLTSTRAKALIDQEIAAPHEDKADEQQAQPASKKEK